MYDVYHATLSLRTNECKCDDSI